MTEKTYSVPLSDTRDLDEVMERTACSSHCPEQWRHHVQELLDLLPEDAGIVQIKAKFGRLRVYLNEYDEVCEELVRQCEQKCGTLK